MTRRELATLFRAERKQFGRYYPRTARAGLCVSDRTRSPGSPGGFRDVAWCIPKLNMVFVLARALQFPKQNLVAILRHELGHLSDRDVDKPEAERRADRIAEKVTGRRIRYDRRAVQTTGRGGPRPRSLHR